MCFLRRVSGLYLRERAGGRERARELRVTQEKIATPPCRQEPVEVGRASGHDASWGSVTRKFNWEETPGKTHDTLARLYIGQGMPWNHPSRTVRGG